MKEQDFGDARVPWTQDWKRYLNKNGMPFITDADVSCADPRITIDAPTPTDDGTSVTFFVSQVGITKATALPMTVHVTLADNTELEQDFWILFTNI